MREDETSGVVEGNLAMMRGREERSQQGGGPKRV